MLADSMPGWDGPGDEQAATVASSAPATSRIRTFPPVRTTSPQFSRNTVGQRNLRRRAEEAMTGKTRRARRGRGAGRAAIVAGGAGLGVLALAGTAFAHVTITPTSAPQ